MQRVFGSIWAVLIALFVVAIPIQFYLAGHGAMEGAYSAYCADKTNKCTTPLMITAWDPHVIVGTLMLLVSLLILLTALAARPGRRILWMSVALFVFMVIQYILPFTFDSASTRWIAALHAVNALIVTGLAGTLLYRAWTYLPGTGRSQPTTPAPVKTATTPT